MLAADRAETMGGRQMVERIAEQYPNVTTCDAPGRYTGAWAEVARQLRLGLDYLRFLEPRYAETPHLRQRARERAPRLVARLAESPLGVLVGGRRGLTSLLSAAERGLPISAAMRQFLLEQQPDVVLITPLIDLGSPQLDHFAAARALGVRTVLPVGSWDHLSSKALLRAVPDRVAGLEPRCSGRRRSSCTACRRTASWSPARSATTSGSIGRRRAAGEEFCARVGLDPARPFVLYTCSSLFRGTVSEPDVVERVDPRAADQHRSAAQGHRHPDPAAPGAAGRVARRGSLGSQEPGVLGRAPVDDEAKDDYFDSMYYSAAVVGINTSAFIEAAASASRSTRCCCRRCPATTRKARCTSAIC